MLLLDNTPARTTVTSARLALSHGDEFPSTLSLSEPGTGGISLPFTATKMGNV